MPAENVDRQASKVEHEGGHQDVICDVMSSVEVLAGRRYLWPRSQGVCSNLDRKT